MPSATGAGATGFFAGSADGGIVTTSAANDTHSHTFTTGNGGGVGAGSQEGFTPQHYVINYIIYKGPVGA